MPWRGVVGERVEKRCALGCVLANTHGSVRSRLTLHAKMLTCILCVRACVYAYVRASLSLSLSLSLVRALLECAHAGATIYALEKHL